MHRTAPLLVDLGLPDHHRAAAVHFLDVGHVQRRQLGRPQRRVGPHQDQARVPQPAHRTAAVGRRHQGHLIGVLPSEARTPGPGPGRCPAGEHPQPCAASARPPDRAHVELRTVADRRHRLVDRRRRLARLEQMVNVGRHRRVGLGTVAAPLIPPATRPDIGAHRVGIQRRTVQLGDRGTGCSRPLVPRWRRSRPQQGPGGSESRWS